MVDLFGKQQNLAELSTRLKFLSAPKKIGNKFVSHPCIQDRCGHNNYNEGLHQKDFCGTVLGLREKYKWSDSGLSFKYNSKSKVLQKMTIEERARLKAPLKVFKEFQEAKNNEIIVIIEHCTNCKSHQITTRHIQEKYVLYAKTLKQLILMNFPMIKVYSKQVSSGTEEFRKSIKIKPGNSSALFIENYRPELRLGAFEVQLYKKSHDKTIHELLHSKLNTLAWPNLKNIIYKISKYVPSVSVKIKLYSKIVERSFEGTKVMLKPNENELDEKLIAFNKALDTINSQQNMSRNYNRSLSTVRPIGSSRCVTLNKDLNRSTISTARLNAP